MKKILLLLYIFLTLIIINGCSGTKKTISEQETLTYSIIIGAGGGFSGSYEGNYIDSSGSVYSWEGSSFITSQKTLKNKLTPAQISELNKLIKENSLEKITYNKHGNLTTFLTFKSSDKEYNFSWVDTLTEDESPKELKTLYNYIFDTLTKNK